MNLSTIFALQAQHKLDGRLVYQGLPVSVENRKGSVRKGKCEPGKPHTCWRTKMTAHYGALTHGMEGVDGDKLDVFIGPNPNADTVYIVSTKKAPAFKEFDEHKCMLGFDSAVVAKKAFIENYGGDARHFGSMTAMPFDQFKAKVQNPKANPHKLTASKLEQAMEVEKVRANMGEPGVYDGGMAHLQPVPSFHPPSLKKAKRVPTDSPGETDDTYLDVTKRKDAATNKFRTQQTKKHNTLGGIPPNTAVQHHTSWGTGSAPVL